MDDPDWRAENINDLKGKVRGADGVCKQHNCLPPKKTTTHRLERWLQSRTAATHKRSHSRLDELKTRTALQTALFETWNDLRWYIQRKGNTEAKALGDAVKDLAKDACTLCAFHV